MMLLLNKWCRSRQTGAEELLAQFCSLLTAKKWQLFGLLVLYYRTVHLSLISIGDPGVSEAGNVSIFMCYVC